MTIKQMNDHIAKIRRQAAFAIDAIEREYAVSNNPYAVGDIIEDHYHIIKIESIRVGVSNNIPVCIYEGIQLKRDLTPYKKPLDGTMWQSNVKKLHNA